MQISKPKIVNRVVLNNATLTQGLIQTTGYSNAIAVHHARQIDLLSHVDDAGVGSTVTFDLEVIEPSSGAVIRTYTGTQITGSGVDYLTVQRTIGTHVRVKYTYMGTFENVYVRVVAK